METKENITIFHIYRKDGTTLFLHPFENPNKLLSVLKKADVQGKFGREPRVESLTMFRNDLYRMIEAAVKSWVLEVRFIPRFLVSAGSFLLAYLFLSFVIRDPIPIIDEILIGGGIALVVYYMLGRRDQRSSLALKKRVELRTAVDRIVFKEDPFVREVESALQLNETEGKEKVLKQMLDNVSTQFSIEDHGDAEQMLSYLEKRFSSKEYKKKEKFISRTRARAALEKDVEVLSRWSDSRKIDVSLFDVYRRVKKSYRQVK
ncbi:MAG: hypothetical protein HN368_22910 [Spirochaetales bacterium]|jgi:hypothetical protein|nr:hypothetical protein [Spirochaetales bacterium]